MSAFRSPLWWAAVLAALPVWLLMGFFWTPQPRLPGPAWLMLVLVYPLLEELVFRGGLQARLADHRWAQRNYCGVSIANGLAAAVFALMHLLVQTAPWAAAVFVPGLLFGYCFERWGLGAAVALHVWYNAGFFTLYPPGA